jgi:hypothetical protein
VSETEASALKSSVFAIAGLPERAKQSHPKRQALSQNPGDAMRLFFAYRWIAHNASFGFLDMPRPALGQIHFLDRL